MEILMVYITASDKKEANSIGEILVKERLAACVNILGEINSIYWWNDQIEHGTEIALIAKTESRLVDQLIEKVKSIHSYECPCIVSWKLDQINTDYKNWLVSELNPEKM